jgi:C4-dicarboxylate-specific signal transduction histidine kinase
MGLGLSACKEILTYYGGDIRYFPLKSGNRFEVTLKVAGAGEGHEKHV